MTSIEKFPRVTVAAVMRDYESAAEEVEAMGAELISAAKKWEEMTATVHNIIRDTAEAYREEGRKIFGRIEECAQLTEEVRKTCEEFKRSILEGHGEIQ